MHIEKLQIHIPLSDVSESKVGIDFGHELVKICYISKSESDDKTKVVDLLLFDRAHIREALQHVASHEHLPVDLHVTGTVTEEVKQLVKEELHTEEVHQVNETDAEMKGHFTMLRECREEDLVFPGEIQPRCYGEVKMTELHQEIFANVRRQLTTGRTDSNRFPCVVANIGSQTSFTRLNEDGSYKVLFFSSSSVMTLNFLISALLGINEDHLHMASELSRHGNRCHVDTQIKDILSPDTPEYGRAPPDMPMFGFGKLADKEDVHLETLKKEDVAHSILGHMCLTWYFEMFGAALGEAVPLVYIGGTVMREKTVREELYYAARCWAMAMIDDKYYQTGMYAAALGCLLH